MLVFSFLLLIPSSPFPTPPQLINQGLIYLPSIPTALSLWRPYTKVMLTSELELLLQGQSPSLMPRLSLGDYTRDKVFSPSLCTSVQRQDRHFPSYISPPSLSLSSTPVLISPWRMFQDWSIIKGCSLMAERFRKALVRWPQDDIALSHWLAFCRERQFLTDLHVPPFLERVWV